MTTYVRAARGFARRSTVGTIPRDKAKELYEDGLTQAAIAAVAGVTRERIRQVLKQEIPDFDGRLNSRVEKVAHLCPSCGDDFLAHLHERRVSCGKPACKTVVFSLGQRNSLRVLDAYHKAEKIYALRETGLTWRAIADHEGRFGPTVITAAKAAALRNGWAWPIPGVDGRKKRADG